MFELDIIVAFILAHPSDNFTPELRDLEHIGLVYRSNFTAPFARGFERDHRDAFDLGRGVNFGIYPPLRTIRQFRHALGLSEIDSPGEFTHDQKISPLHDLPFESGG